MRVWAVGYTGGVTTCIWRCLLFFFFSSRRRHTRFDCDWSSDVCSSDLLLFARPSEPHLVTVPVEEPLKDVQRLLSAQLEKSGISLACENSVSARICIDPQQIKQVLINLVQNAADSIGQNGVVTLRARLSSIRLGERMTDVVVLE